MIHSLVVDTRPYQWIDAAVVMEGPILNTAVFTASKGACQSEM